MEVECSPIQSNIDSNYALESLSQTKYDVIGLSWTIDPRVARQQVGSHRTLQGNLDPCVLFAEPPIIQDYVKRMLSEFGTQRYIANLGHGLLPEHNPDHVASFIHSVHLLSQQINNDNK